MATVQSRKRGAARGSTTTATPRWQVYIVRCSDGTLYTGTTTDIRRRVDLHNAGKGSRYVRSRRPVTVVWSVACPSRSRALREEARIKRLSRAEKLELLAAVPRSGR